MTAASLLTLCLLSAAAVVPPLSDTQVGRLETARDGQDHREEAFVALVENARAFTGDGPEIAGAAPVRLAPDLDALLADPAVHRGALCRIVGVLQQTTPLARPHADATEWFVRDAGDRPILVYVVGLTPEDESTFRPGTDVVVYARFYKRVDAAARDGTTRGYPAFVGARPWRPAGSAAGAGSSILLPVMVVLLAGLGAVFVLLIVLTRRQRARGRPRPAGVGAGALGEPDEGGPLPDDPVEALAELKRRAAEGG